jgi:esterase
LNLHFKSYGEQGEYIFILHGLFGMLDNWHNIARSLSSEYRVISIDARNHGQSPHDDAMTYELMAEDVIELADNLNVETFILMGHSMGGKTAMRAALMFPERISKLIIVDIAPKAYPASHSVYFKAFEEIEWANMQNRTEIDEALKVYEKNDGVRLFLAKNIDRLDSGGFAVKSNIPAIKSAYEHIGGEFKMDTVYNGKTLFIYGEKSNYLLDKDRPLINQHFPNNQYSMVKNASHWVHAENPSDFLNQLDQFLKSN